MVLLPVQVTVGRGHEDSIAFNRRYLMKDGSTGWNPGLLNPNIVKPAGTIDPEVPVVWFEATAKKPVAAYVNYAVHLDNVGGTQISSDLPYTLAKLLAEVKGPDLVTLYTTGTCGDVNHVNVNWGVRQSGHANAARSQRGTHGHRPGRRGATDCSQIEARGAWPPPRQKRNRPAAFAEAGTWRPGKNA
jgi:hypothetical protein